MWVLVYVKTIIKIYKNFAAHREHLLSMTVL